jgi:MFS family permease
MTHPLTTEADILRSPIVGFFSDRAASRRLHFLFGLLLLLLSTIFVALARTYPLMILARVLQGSASAVAWTVGLAVLADTLPTEQLGIAMGTIGSVVSFAMVTSPVIGGAIFHAFGFHAVFWFLGAMLVVDVLLRLLMIERKDAIRWGYITEEEVNGGTSEDAPLLTSQSNEESDEVQIQHTSVIRLLLVSESSHFSHPV